MDSLAYEGLMQRPHQELLLMDALMGISPLLHQKKPSSTFFGGFFSPVPKKRLCMNKNQNELSEPIMKKVLRVPGPMK